MANRHDHERGPVGRHHGSVDQGGFRRDTKNADEQLLTVSCSLETLNYRCNLSLWTALVEQALLQVSRHRQRRERLLAEFAAWADRRGGALFDRWTREAHSYKHVQFDLRSTTSFSLLLMDTYAEGEVGAQVTFALNDKYGVRLQGAGISVDQRDHRPRISRPSEANGVAVRIVSDVLSDLKANERSIPRPEDHDPSVDDEDDSDQDGDSFVYNAAKTQRAVERAQRSANGKAAGRPSVMKPVVVTRRGARRG